MIARQPDPAIAELQRLRPAKLRVYVRDSDEPKAVAIPANRKKWERLATTLEGMEWRTIEALDPRGNITGVVARPDDDAGAVLGEDAPESEDVSSLLGLMLKAQQVALQQQAVLIKPLIDGQAKLVETMTTALGAVAGAYRMALAAASVPAGRGGDGGGESDEGLGRFLQVAMMMMQARGGGGPPAAIAAVKAAADVARPSTAKTATSPASAAAPGR